MARSGWRVTGLFLAGSRTPALPTAPSGTAAEKRWQEQRQRLARSYSVIEQYVCKGFTFFLD